MWPQRGPRARSIEREQDLGGLAAVQRPERQQVEQAPHQIDLNRETSRSSQRRSRRRSFCIAPKLRSSRCRGKSERPTRDQTLKCSAGVIPKSADVTSITKSEEHEPGRGPAEHDGQPLPRRLALCLAVAQPTHPPEHDRRRAAEGLAPSSRARTRGPGSTQNRKRPTRATIGRLWSCQPSTAMTTQNSGWTRTGIPSKRNRRS